MQSLSPRSRNKSDRTNHQPAQQSHASSVITAALSTNKFPPTLSLCHPHRLHRLLQTRTTKRRQKGISSAGHPHHSLPSTPTASQTHARRAHTHSSAGPSTTHPAGAAAAQTLVFKLPRFELLVTILVTIRRPKAAPTFGRFSPAQPTCRPHLHQHPDVELAWPRPETSRSCLLPPPFYPLFSPVLPSPPSDSVMSAATSLLSYSLDSSASPLCSALLCYIPSSALFSRHGRHTINLLSSSFRLHMKDRVKSNNQATCREEEKRRSWLWRSWLLF